MLAASCSCVPSSAAPWLVFAILALGSGAVLLAGRRWQRRPAGAGPPSARVSLRALVAAVLLAGLALTAVVVKPDTDGSLVVLGMGLVVASAGLAPSSWRRRDTRVG
jgi:hypothetical protein